MSLKDSLVGPRMRTTHTTLQTLLKARHQVVAPLQARRVLVQQNRLLQQRAFGHL